MTEPALYGVFMSDVSLVLERWCETWHCTKHYGPVSVSSQVSDLGERWFLDVKYRFGPSGILSQRVGCGPLVVYGALFGAGGSQQAGDPIPICSFTSCSQFGECKWLMASIVANATGRRHPQ